MNALTSLPTSLKVASSALAIAIAIRITTVVIALSQAETAATLDVARTYIFWAAVCVPVAMLGELVMRTIANYEVVQSARQRVRK